MRRHRWDHALACVHTRVHTRMHTALFESLAHALYLFLVFMSRINVVLSLCDSVALTGDGVLISFSDHRAPG